MSLTDGLVTVRATQVLLAGDVIAGWVDYDTDRDWLGAGEVYVRYDVLPLEGDIALRALKLVLHHLATRTAFSAATLKVPAGDTDSAAVAAAAGFSYRADLQGDQLFARQVPPLTYTDGVVTIRRQRIEDIGQHLAAIDDEQIDWLWEPGDREKWEALTPAQQRAGNLEYLRACHDSFGIGPKWTFSVDSADATYVAYVDCDLANNLVPPGEANIAYTAHPAYRGRGHVSRAVRLVLQFLRDHTGAQSAHIIVDARNTASLRVARAVGATETERWQDEHGRTMIRHVVSIR